MIYCLNVVWSTHNCLLWNTHPIVFPHSSYITMTCFLSTFCSTDLWILICKNEWFITSKNESLCVVSFEMIQLKTLVTDIRFYKHRSNITFHFEKKLLLIDNTINLISLEIKTYLKCFSNFSLSANFRTLFENRNLKYVKMRFFQIQLSINWFKNYLCFNQLKKKVFGCYVCTHFSLKSLNRFELSFAYYIPSKSGFKTNHIKNFTLEHKLLNILFQFLFNFITFSFVHPHFTSDGWT